MAFSKTAINRIIFVLFVVLIAGAIYYFVHINKIMNQLERRLDYSEGERLRLQTDLDASRSIIDSQKTQLQSAEEEKQALEQELDDLEVQLLQVQELLNNEKQRTQTLESDRQKLQAALTDAQEEIRLWRGEIVSLDEVSTVLAKRKSAKRQFVRNIRTLREKVYQEKIKLQKEIDRMQLEAGNRGYLTRNGKPTSVSKDAVELDKIIIRSPAAR